MSVARVGRVVDSILWVIHRTMEGRFEERREILYSTREIEFLDKGSEVQFLKRTLIFR
jgi:hypothetical protein